MEHYGELSGLAKKTNDSGFALFADGKENSGTLHTR
jgi:hypothetical protein